MNIHEHACSNICFRNHSHHDQQFRTGLRGIRNGKGVFLPDNVSNPHFMPRCNSSANLMFMIFGCYISSFTNITRYVMSLTKTLFMNEYANVIIIHVFLFELRSCSILHSFLSDDDHRSARHFCQYIYLYLYTHTSDSLVH